MSDGDYWVCDHCGWDNLYSTDYCDNCDKPREDVERDWSDDGESDETV